MSDYTITLDQYERDNLLSFLASAAAPGPFSAGNSGDWLMQVLYLIGWEGPATDWGRPNSTVDEIVERQHQYNMRYYADGKQTRLV